MMFCLEMLAAKLQLTEGTTKLLTLLRLGYFVTRKN